MCETKKRILGAVQGDLWPSSLRRKDSGFYFHPSYVLNLSLQLTMYQITVPPKFNFAIAIIPFLQKMFLEKISSLTQNFSEIILFHVWFNWNGDNEKFELF